MALLMPIQPEPASRIRSAHKWFELRKMRPPEAGITYLYETSDSTSSVNAIRTAIQTDEYLELPLDELWKRVGEFATSRQKFLSYFGGKYRYGIAIPIIQTEILSRPVLIEELRRVDPDFNLPKGPWTYLKIEDSSPLASYLAKLVGRVATA